VCKLLGITARSPKTLACRPTSVFRLPPLFYVTKMFRPRLRMLMALLLFACAVQGRTQYIRLGVARGAPGSRLSTENSQVRVSVNTYLPTYI